MVELRLAATDGEEVSSDFYVSVRVGEMQKLTKANKARVYKFPASVVGARRYGKIEVFKRIGSCSVNIDPAVSDGNALDINVPFDPTQNVASDLAGMNFRVQVAAGDGKPNISPEKKKDDSSLNPKVVAAKGYVEAHNLEQRLADAMQALLKARPADPSQFLAEKLVASKPPAGWVPPSRPGTRGAPGVSEMCPFQSFYNTNFRSMDTNAWSKINTCFPDSRPGTSAAVARACVGGGSAIENYAMAASTVRLQDLNAAVAGVSLSGMQKLVAAIGSVSVQKSGGSAAAITDRLVTSWACASVRGSSQSALTEALQGVAPAQRKKLTDALSSFDEKPAATAPPIAGASAGAASVTSRFVNTWIGGSVFNASESDMKAAVGGISASAIAKLETALRQLSGGGSAYAGPIDKFVCTLISGSVRKASESELKAALAGVSGSAQLKLKQAITSL